MKYNYYYDQLEIAKELLSKTQYDAVLDLLVNELDALESQEDYFMLGEYLHLIISSYINKGDLNTVESLLERLKNTLSKSNHPSLKVSYAFHVGCFFYLSNNLADAITMFERALSYLDSNQQDDRFISVCTALSVWNLQLGNLESAFYYHDLALPFASNTKNSSPLIYGQFMTHHAHCLMYKNELDEAYAILCDLWEHPILTRDPKIYIVTSCNFACYYSIKKDIEQLDAFIEKSWAMTSEMDDIPFKIRILSRFIQSYETIPCYEKAYYFSKLKIQLLESTMLSQQQERFQEFALRTREHSLNLIAYIDSLTQVYNRHYFEEYASRWLFEAKKNNTTLCCALFDVDNFKQINDCYGHVTGDQILQTIGSVLKKHEIPNEFFAARYGGDEFILISNTPQTFNETIDFLFSELQQIEIPYEQELLTFTISLGAAVIDDLTNYTINDVIHKADEQLYIVKRNGKNNVQFCY